MSARSIMARRRAAERWYLARRDAAFLRAIGREKFVSDMDRMWNHIEHRSVRLVQAANPIFDQMRRLAGA